MKPLHCCFVIIINKGNFLNEKEWFMYLSACFNSNLAHVVAAKIG